MKDNVLKKTILGFMEKKPVTGAGKRDFFSEVLFGKSNVDKRGEALDRIAAVTPSVWKLRLLLWTLADKNPATREHAWSILEKQTGDFDLLVNELSCPLWQTRIGAIRLLAKTGRLDAVRRMLAGCDDYHRSVAAETMKGLSLLIDNAKIRKQKGELPREETEDAIRALMQILNISKRRNRYQALQFLFTVAPLGEDIFWNIYSTLELSQRLALHEQFIHYQSYGALDVLYRGLLQQNEKVIEKITNFLCMAIRLSGRNVNYHLRAILKLNKDEFLNVAFTLHYYRVLVEFQGLISFIGEPERIALFDLLETVGAEQNLSFLLRCLQLDDSRIRIRILKVLGNSEELGLRNEVFEFLTETDERLLLATLRYLYKKGDLTIIDRISHLLQSKKKKVRQAAIDTIYKILKDYLLNKFDSCSRRKRKILLEYLIRLKPNFLEEMSYLSTSPEELDRLKYLAMLDVENLGTAIPVYRRMSRDPNSKIRATVIAGFGRIKNEEIRFKALKYFFNDPDPRVRANAIERLPVSKPTSELMINLVKKSAQSDALREKANSLKQLLLWGYQEYESVLIEMLESDDEWTKTCALWVVGEVDLPHLEDYLRDGANDRRPHIREMAVRGIGIKGTDEDIRALMPFLQDPVYNVRKAAQQALRSRLHMEFEIAKEKHR